MNQFVYNQLCIDFLSQQISVNQQAVKLDPKAFATLKLMIEQRNRVVSNEELIEHVWQNRAISTEVIVAAIARIRKMFKQAGIEEEAIRTIHKVGYKFVLESEQSNSTPSPIVKGPRNRHKELNYVLSVALILCLGLVLNSHFLAEKSDESYEMVPILEDSDRSNNQSKLSANLPATQLIFLRHAEKEFDGSDDPALSDMGRDHAEYWRKLLQHIEFDAIYTTKYVRNMETAKIVANGATDKIKIYSALSFDIVKHLERFKGQTILIIAHSNTIPGMVNRAIGKNQHEPMSLEDYQSIFHVVIDSNGTPSSQQFHVAWPSE